MVQVFFPIKIVNCKRILKEGLIDSFHIWGSECVLSSGSVNTPPQVVVHVFIGTQNCENPSIDYQVPMKLTPSRICGNAKLPNPKIMVQCLLMSKHLMLCRSAENVYPLLLEYCLLVTTLANTQLSSTQINKVFPKFILPARGLHGRRKQCVVLERLMESRLNLVALGKLNSIKYVMFLRH